MLITEFVVPCNCLQALVSFKRSTLTLPSSTLTETLSSLKLNSNVPLGPLVVILLPSTLTSTPYGIVNILFPILLITHLPYVS